jgi:hypothetical protein
MHYAPGGLAHAIHRHHLAIVQGRRLSPLLVLPT